MTADRLAELRDEPVLVACIRRTAYRYFGRTEDAEDAEAEAWGKILTSPGDLQAIDYVNVARKAISAMYMRQWRRRKHEIKIDR